MAKVQRRQEYVVKSRERGEDRRLLMCDDEKDLD